ncbi:MAG: hypothetical protein LBQ84_00755 [Flavobacteriaceae bacterium]|jgi:hypothetical protein|nr:hypothetical protein [Flavobacteriaceae bacterium]
MSKTFIIENGQEIPVGSSRGIYTERSAPHWIKTFNVPVGYVINGNKEIIEQRWTCPRDGTYLLRFGLLLDPAANLTLCTYYKNGAFQYDNLFGFNSTYAYSSYSIIVDLVAGDVIAPGFRGTAANTTAGISNMEIAQLLVSIPYIVADNSALISSPAQGDVSLRQDGTAFVNDNYSFTEQATNQRWVGGQIIYKQTFDRGAWNFDTTWTDTGIDLPVGSMILNNEVCSQSSAFGGQILNRGDVEFRADASGNVFSWTPAAHNCSAWWPTLYYIKG